MFLLRNKKNIDTFWLKKAPQELWMVFQCICYVTFLILQWKCMMNIQSNLNSSNTNGWFTMADSNLCLSSYEILRIAPENNYSRKLYYEIVFCVYSLDTPY